MRLTDPRQKAFNPNVTVAIAGGNHADIGTHHHDVFWAHGLHFDPSGLSELCLPWLRRDKPSKSTETEHFETYGHIRCFREDLNEFSNLYQEFRDASEILKRCVVWICSTPAMLMSFGGDSRPEPSASQQPCPHPILSTLRCPRLRL